MSSAKKNRLSMLFETKRKKEGSPSPSPSAEQEQKEVEQNAAPSDEASQLLKPDGVDLDNLSDASSQPKADDDSNPHTPRKSSVVSNMFSWKPKKHDPQVDQMITLTQVPALEGESIASRYEMGDAHISGDFFKIEYGTFKGRPAVMIVVDLRLVYQEKTKINAMNIEFRFGKNDTPPPDQEPPSPGFNTESPTPKTATPPSSHLPQPDKSSIPLVSKCFAPDELAGQIETIHVIQSTQISPHIQGLSFGISGGGGGKREITNRNFRWYVQGYLEKRGPGGGSKASKVTADDPYNTLRWTISPNGISLDSVPHKLRLGMIAFHTHEPFWTEVSVKASLKPNNGGKYGVSKEKRWFNPPSAEEVGTHVLQEIVLREMVKSANQDLFPVAVAPMQHQLLIDASVPVGEGGGSGVMGELASLLEGVGGGMASDLIGGGYLEEGPASPMDNSSAC